MAVLNESIVSNKRLTTYRYSEEQIEFQKVTWERQHLQELQYWPLLGSPEKQKPLLRQWLKMRSSSYLNPWNAIVDWLHWLSPNMSDFSSRWWLHQCLLAHFENTAGEPTYYLTLKSIPLPITISWIMLFLACQCAAPYGHWAGWCILRPQAPCVPVTKLPSFSTRSFHHLTHWQWRDKWLQQYCIYSLGYGKVNISEREKEKWAFNLKQKLPEHRWTKCESAHGNLTLFFYCCSVAVPWTRKLIPWLSRKALANYVPVYNTQECRHSKIG